MKLNWYPEKAMEQIEDAGKKALMEAAADLSQRSADEAPIDKGDLRGNVAIDDSNLDKGFVFVGYSLPYALRQHEELGYNHPQGGKAKYLEDPFNANVNNYKRHIASAIDKAAS